MLVHTEFNQTNGILHFNTLQCLRNDYLYNECSLCMTYCRDNAIVITKNKIGLLPAACTSCGDCIGVCPTEAFSLDTFDPLMFVLWFVNQKKTVIYETIDVPSLHVFNEHYLVGIVLRIRQNLHLVCDAKRDLSYLNQILERANNFLKDLGIEFRVLLELTQKQTHHERRNLLKIFYSLKKDTTHRDYAKQIKQNSSMLGKQIFFRNSLQEDYDVSDKKIKADSFIYQKNIDHQLCTNCKDCITFCPTKALTASQNSIFFNSILCIGCGICHHICKDNAIVEIQECTIQDFILSQPQKIASFVYIPCTNCKTPFTYTEGNEKICKNCSSHGTEFDNMFVLAKDIKEKK